MGVGMVTGTVGGGPWEGYAPGCSGAGDAVAFCRRRVATDRPFSASSARKAAASSGVDGRAGTPQAPVQATNRRQAWW